MPHIFKVECYRRHAERGKAKRGDVVYLKSRTDVPMTVLKPPAVNSAAGKCGSVDVTYLKADGEPHNATFAAEQLSL